MASEVLAQAIAALAAVAIPRLAEAPVSLRSRFHNSDTIWSRMERAPHTEDIRASPHSSGGTMALHTGGTWIPCPGAEVRREDTCAWLRAEPPWESLDEGSPPADSADAEYVSQMAWIFPAAVSHTRGTSSLRGARCCRIADTGSLTCQPLSEPRGRFCEATSGRHRLSNASFASAWLIVIVSSCIYKISPVSFLRQCAAVGA